MEGSAVTFKRIVLVLLAAALCASLVQGCRREPQPASPAAERNKPGQPVEITFSSLETGTETAQKLSDLFMRENPDIRVKTLILPPISDLVHNEFVGRLVTGNAGIDLFALDVIWIAEFAEAGWLAPLDTQFSEAELKSLLPQTVQGCTYRGRLYCVPWYADMGVLFYRKDLLQEAGLAPPKTWEELIRTALALKGKGGTEYGYLFQGNKYEGLTLNFLEYVWANGGDIVDSRRNVALDTANAAGALDFLQELLKTGAAPEDVLRFKETESRKLFLEGKSVFLRSGPIVWGLSNGETSKVAGKIGIAPLPAGPLGSGEAIGGIGGSYIGLNANLPAERREAAIRFAKFLISPEAQKLIAVEHSRIPVRQTTYEDPDVLRFNPYYPDILRLFRSAKSRPNVPDYSELSDMIQIGVHDALTHHRPSADVLMAMQKLVDER